MYRTGPRSSTYVVKKQKSLEIERFSLKFNSREVTMGSKSESDYLIEIEAEMVGEYSDDELRQDVEKVMGYVKATIIQVSRAMNAGESLWDICDDHSQNLANVYTGLFDKEGDVKDSIYEHNDGQTGDILFIDEVFLEEQYRGYGIGLLAVDTLISSLPSFEMDTVVLNPAGVGRLAGPKYQHDVAVQKLTDHWSLMGFRVWAKRCGDFDVLMGIWTGRNRVAIEEVVPHLTN